ncbi:TonB-dependent receptor [Novosphingobium sp. 11B]
MAVLSRLLIGALSVSGIAISGPLHAQVAQTQVLVKIPASKLESGLDLLMNQTRQQILYAPSLVQGKTTMPLVGIYAPDHALALLLRGTGLRFLRTANGAYVLEANQAPPASRAPDGPATRTVAAATANDAGVEEIVVTAQKRTENLNTTAISADVLSAARLDQKHITTQLDLALVTPSLAIGDGGISAAVNIRGVGLSLSSGIITSGVAVYRDGMFQLPSAQDEPLFDMASVEVLRGPQGTFVGSNSTGGAIFYNTANPEFGDVKGYVKAGYGAYNDVSLQGAVNLPISNTLAARVSYFLQRRDSFFKQEGTIAGDTALPTLLSFRHPGNLDKKMIRIGLMWEPNSNFTLLSKTAFWQNRSDGYAHVMATDNAYYDGRPLRYVLDYNVPNTQDNGHYFRQILQADYTFDSGLNVRATAGYVHVSSSYIDDFDSSSSPGDPSTGLPPANSVFANKPLGRLYTQEIDVISKRDARFSWIAGAFHYWQLAVAHLNIALPGVTVQGDVPPYRSAWAPFAQGTYQLVPGKLEIQAGARYTRSKSWQKGQTTLYFPGSSTPLVIQQAARQSDSAVTGKIGLNWTISPNQYAYAFAAKGYKAGGTNGPNSPNFRPEIVYDYEAGLKSKLFDGHLNTQINAFYMDYRHLQLSNYITPTGSFGGATGVSNAGPSKIWGFEAQAQARFGALSLDANVSNVNSKLGDTFYINANALPGGGSSPLGPQCGAGAPSNPPTCFDYGPYSRNLSGQPNPYSPKFTFNGGVGYDIGVGNGTLTPRVSFTYIAKQNQSVLNDRANRIAAHSITNVSLTYNSDAWTVELYCTNCTNSIYQVGNTFGPAYFLGAPRQYGLSVQRNF